MQPSCCSYRSISRMQRYGNRSISTLQRLHPSKQTHPLSSSPPVCTIVAHKALQFSMLFRPAEPIFKGANRVSDRERFGGWTIAPRVPIYRVRRSATSSDSKNCCNLFENKGAHRTYFCPFPLADVVCNVPCASHPASISAAKCRYQASNAILNSQTQLLFSRVPRFRVVRDVTQKINWYEAPTYRNYTFCQHPRMGMTSAFPSNLPIRFWQSCLEIRWSENMLQPCHGNAHRPPVSVQTYCMIYKLKPQTLENLNQGLILGRLR